MLSRLDRQLFGTWVTPFNVLAYPYCAIVFLAFLFAKPLDFRARIRPISPGVDCRIVFDMGLWCLPWLGFARRKDVPTKNLRLFRDNRRPSFGNRASLHCGNAGDTDNGTGRCCCGKGRRRLERDRKRRLQGGVLTRVMGPRRSVVYTDWNSSDGELSSRQSAVVSHDNGGHVFHSPRTGQRTGSAHRNRRNAVPCHSGADSLIGNKNRRLCCRYLASFLPSATSSQ